MASVALNGRREGFSSAAATEQEASKIIQSPNIWKATVLRKSDWIQIQVDLNRDTKDKQHLREAAEQTEALHLQSKSITAHRELMAEKSARFQQLKEEERNFDAKNAQLLIEEEKRFQQYSQRLISTAVEAKQNVFPLYKAAEEGVGPIYMVHDATGARLLKYVTNWTTSLGTELTALAKHHCIPYIYNN